MGKKERKSKKERGERQKRERDKQILLNKKMCY